MNNRAFRIFFTVLIAAFFVTGLASCAITIDPIVSFDSNGGSPCENVEVDGTAKTLPLPSKDGYDFDGWYFDNQTFENKATDTMLSDGSIQADTTLYAKWNKIIYIVSFDSNGGSACDNVEVDGTAKTLPLPSKDGYDFDGWYFDNQTFENKATDTMLSDGTIQADTTLYAKWKITVLSAEYIVDGASYRIVTSEYGTPLPTPDTMMKDGAAFDGWYADESMTQEYDFSAPVTASVKLYGRFLTATSENLLKFTLANDYFGYDCCGVTGVVSGAALPKDLIIPSSVDGYPVVCIFWDSFKKQTGIESVFVPDTVTTIASGAFSGCTALETVRLPKTLVEIGESVFYDTAIYNNAPDGYFYVGNALFDFKGATPANFEVTVKEGTRVITDRLFWLDTNVVKVNLPASVIALGYSSFLRSPITEFTVAEGSETFTAVDGVLFSKDMKELVYYPVGNARERYVVPDTVERIADQAFTHLYYLKSVVFPDSVKTLGDGTFNESVSLEEVTFGAGIESVGDGVLYEIKSLKRIFVNTPNPFRFGQYFLTASGTPKFDIYIADEFLETYKADQNWGTAASRMKAVSEYTA